MRLSSTLPQICTSQRQFEWMNNLFTMADDLVPQSWCTYVMGRMTALIDDGKVPLITDPTDEHSRRYITGAHKFYLFTGSMIQAEFPQLIDIYHDLLPQLKVLTGQEVCASSYCGSDINFINAKIYRANGGKLPAHTDSNKISCILHLTTNTEGALHLQPNVPGSAQQQIFCKAGRVFFMQGRRVRHWVDEMISEDRGVVCMNFWTEGDTDRTSEVQRRQGGDWDETMKQLVAEGLQRAAVA